MKKNVAIVLFSLVASLIYAIPGVEHFINDQSGEFVYYRDYSFSRESYIGFLTYDQGTFAARYFAPATDNLLPKSIEILFTIDPEKDYIEMTGERFVTMPLQEDTDLINYIHDLIYEFSARRKKVGEISPLVQQNAERNLLVEYVSSTKLIDSGFRRRDEFEQFGGDVFVYYDYLVPIFNLKKIVSNSGDVVLEIVATGKLNSAEDKSFSDFQILPEEIFSKKKNAKTKSAKSKIIQLEKTTLCLDDAWTNAGNLENMFFYGNSAMLYVGLINSEDYYNYLKMCFNSSVQGFVAWNKISVLQDSTKTTITTEKNTLTKSYHLICSIITKNQTLQQEENAFLTLTISKKDYENSRKYFSDIVKSWK